MSRDLRNRLAASSYGLQFPAELHPSEGGGKVDLYVQTGTGGADPEAKPFRRRIDLWGLGLGVALAKDLAPYDGDMRKFVDTRAVEVSEELASLVFVAAVFRLGAENPELEMTSNVVSLCNQLAASGTFEIVNWIEKDSLTTTKMTSVLRHVSELRRTVAEHSVGFAI